MKNLACSSDTTKLSTVNSVKTGNGELNQQDIKSIEEIQIEISNNGKAWNKNDKIRYAGISSFGFGGANSHVILKESVTGNEQSHNGYSTFSSSVPNILPLTAKSDIELNALAKKNTLITYLPIHRIQ